jgi:hypothetical protein
VLTASVLFPSITATEILIILACGVGLSVVAGLSLMICRWRGRALPETITPPAQRAGARTVDTAARTSWRMPPLAMLTRPTLSAGRRLGLIVLRGYLVIAASMVIVRVVQLAAGG